MKTLHLILSTVVISVVIGVHVKAEEPPPALTKHNVVNLSKLFPYNVVILERCRYITYRVSPTQRGLVHAGSCKNPVHSIYRRIASHEG